MFPHPDTVCMLNDLKYQDLLRDAARVRLAASAQQTGGRSPLSIPRSAWLLVASWLGGTFTRVHGTKQAPASPPLSSV